MKQQWSMAANHKEISDLPQNNLKHSTYVPRETRKIFIVFYSFQLKDRAEFLEYVQVFPTDAIKDGPFFHVNDESQARLLN